MQCKKCQVKITQKSIFNWVNSGVGKLQCAGCNREICSPLTLTAIYLFAGFLLVMGINNIQFINTNLEKFGVVIPEFSVAILLIFLLTIMLYFLSLLVVRINA